MKYLKLLFFVTAIITMVQCDVDTDVESQIESDFTHTVIPQQTREFTGSKIKRIRIKKRRIGSGFKVVGKAVASDGIHHYAAVVQEREGVIPVPANFDWMSTDEIDDEGNKTFRFNTLDFEGENSDGKPLQFEITPMDIDNNPVGDTEKVWLTVQDDDGVYVSKVQVMETNNPNTFRLSAKIKGVNVTDVGSVLMQITSLDGTISIPLEPSEASLKSTNNGETGETGVVLTALYILTYDDAGDQGKSRINPMDEVNTTVIIYATNGDLIDDLSFIGTVIPKMEIEGITVGNVSIKQRNNSSLFKLKAPVSGANRDEVAAVYVIFSDYSGPEPLPSEVTMTQTGENTYVDFYTTNEITFDDPEGAMGETYTVIIDLKNVEGNSIASFEKSVIVQ